MTMGLLDMPLISEMDEIEAKAKRGDEAALRMVLDTLPNLQRIYVRKLLGHHPDWSLRDAMEKAGIIICIR